MVDRSEAPQPPFNEAVKFWFRLGWISFGGSAAHIAIMHDFLVSQKKWISDSRFFHALSICMLLPGPEAQQLATYIGKQLHGKKGGIIAGTFFVLPSMFILLALSIIYVLFGQVPLITAAFNGLKPAVIALIFLALLNIGKKALKGPLHYVVAIIAFLLIIIFNIPVIDIIIGTILLALVIRSLFPQILNDNANENDNASVAESDYYINKFSKPQQAPLSVFRQIVQVLVFFFLWLIPLLVLYFALPDFTFWQALIFAFTRAAFFTLGGSYTVLPFVAQFAVSKYNWLSRLQMVDGFALAETTPGPLIIVVGFVGFLSAYNHFHSSILFGSLALLITVYYTFLPCFFYIFAGGPLIEKSHANKAISSVLKLVTAAVVGIILNLTFFLGKDVIFSGKVDFQHINWFSVVWAIISLVLIRFAKLNVLYLILITLTVSILRFALM